MTPLSSEAVRLAPSIHEMNYRAAMTALENVKAERDQLRAELEKVRVPDGWEIRVDGTWVYFRRPDGFCQAVTPNDGHTSHAQTLHMLMRAMLPAATTPPHADQKGQ